MAAAIGTGISIELRDCDTVGAEAAVDEAAHLGRGAARAISSLAQLGHRGVRGEQPLSQA